jgi:hypothetical protein
MYNFYFLPDDFLDLEKFVIHRKDADDNINESPYQFTSNDSFFNRRRDSDERKFFTIVNYNRDDENHRKILVADPFPEDDSYVEIVYDSDGTNDSLERFNSEKYWEVFIRKVESLLGLRSERDAEQEVLKQSSNWRNQEGENKYNNTRKTTKVNNTLFGKS